jgi:hypothetical protein
MKNEDTSGRASKGERTGREAMAGAAVTSRAEPTERSSQASEAGGRAPRDANADDEPGYGYGV